MVQDTGVETALPEAPAPVQAAVEILGILSCQMLQESTDAAFHLARYDEVKVIGHEHVAVDDHLAEIGVMVEQGKELGAALVSEEHLLSIITALCDVERIVRGSESWFAWHLTNKVDFTGHSSPLFCEKKGAGRQGCPSESPDDHDKLFRICILPGAQL